MRRYCLEGYSVDTVLTYAEAERACSPMKGFRSLGDYKDLTLEWDHLVLATVYREYSSSATSQSHETESVSGYNARRGGCRIRLLRPLADDGARYDLTATQRVFSSFCRAADYGMRGGDAYSVNLEVGEVYVPMP